MSSSAGKRHLLDILPLCLYADGAAKVLSPECLLSHKTNIVIVTHCPIPKCIKNIQDQKDILSKMALGTCSAILKKEMGWDTKAVKDDSAVIRTKLRLIVGSLDSRSRGQRLPSQVRMSREIHQRSSSIFLSTG